MPMVALFFSSKRAPCSAHMRRFLWATHPIFRLFDRTLARRSYLFFRIELDDFDGDLPVVKYSLSAGSS